METHLDIDKLLLEEATQYAKVSDKNELIRIVLTEFINNHRKRNLKDLKGKIKFSEKYDYKEMRKNN